ncbi:lipopolysaccharide biosynthesis protein [Psychromonas ossibalaenae]|uniref:lipopolysaccharide biosynthesis protein n=1 Tax=Psychromonas ossibalaenae TaxID=444922 RepID=UPI00036D5303|nr:lipopolysaccharide biosynthesis protein [Psychromonas ossibalaenae]
MSINLIHSVKWSALSEVISKVLPPLFYIVTARLLTPEDFGIVATSAMIIALSNILWEAGLAKKLIQIQDNSKLNHACNIVFYSNVVLALLVYLLLFFSSGLLASFFQQSEISNVIIISGLAIIAGAFSSVQTALLQKFFNYKKLFYARFCGSIIPGIISVTLAYWGYGYWALVIGSVVSLFVQAVVLWMISDWRPTYSYDFKLAKSMFNFSKWVLVSSLLSWCFIWGDIFVLSYFFKLHEVGLYRTGNYFVMTVIGLITAPIVPVMYSYFSSIQNDLKNLGDSLLFTSKCISFFVLPIGVGLFLVQVPLAELVFGEKWLGIGSVLGVLALMHSFSWIIGLNNEAYKAIGRPDLETKVLIFNLFIYAFVYVIAAQISFEIFLMSRLMLALISIFSHIYVSEKLLKIGFVKTFHNIFSILILLLVVVVLNSILLPQIDSLILMLASLSFSLLVYLGGIYILDKAFLLRMMRIISGRNKNVVEN